MITQTHTEILRQGSKRPPVVIAAGDARVQPDVGAYRLDLANMVESPLQLRILDRAGAFAEITWREPATTVGVQFWGDGNDGHARSWSMARCSGRAIRRGRASRLWGILKSPTCRIQRTPSASKTPVSPAAAAEPM